MDAGPTAGMAVLISLRFAAVFDQLSWSNSLSGIINLKGRCRICQLIVIEQSRLFDFIKNPKAILLQKTLSTKKTPKLLKNRKYLNSSMLKSFRLKYMDNPAT